MMPIIFASTVFNKSQWPEIMLLAYSLRSWGGDFNSNSVWAFTPVDNWKESFPPPGVRDHLDSLGVCVVPFSLRSTVQKISPVCPDALKDGVLDFPFVPKVLAAAEAELAVAGTDSLLVWMDSDTFFVREPSALNLQPRKLIGGCPVHHRLIGSPWGHPPDEFWQLIYQRCGVSTERLFSVQTVVEAERIWPYFNAGLLTVRPQAGLLQRWRDHLLRLWNDPAFTVFYNRNPLYRIFMHQAVLAGSLLAEVGKNKITNLSSTPSRGTQKLSPYNYPLNLHHKIPADRRAADLNDLVSIRYDSLDFLRDMKGWETMTSAPALQKWLCETMQ